MQYKHDFPCDNMLHVMPAQSLDNTTAPAHLWMLVKSPFLLKSTDFNSQLIDLILMI